VQGEIFVQASVSPDGKLLVASSLLPRQVFASMTFHTSFWETASGQPIVRRGAITPLAFSPDGKWLAADEDSPVNPLDDEKPKGFVLLDSTTGKEAVALSCRRRIRTAAFSPDGRILACGSQNGDIQIWDMNQLGLSRNTKVQNAGTKNLQRLWEDLEGRDPGQAYAAIRRLSRIAEGSVPLLRARLQPATPASAADIARHIRDLDSEGFAERERAFAALEKLGWASESALRRAMDGKPSLEVVHRVKQLLGNDGPIARDRLRASRSTTVLEWLGTPAARRLLEELACGSAGDPLTEEAKASLRRLQSRQGGEARSK
jgi:hypothetical protein